jgi:hypothetical protein
MTDSAYIRLLWNISGRGRNLDLGTARSKRIPDAFNAVRCPDADRTLAMEE